METGSSMGLPAGAFHHLFDTEWFRVARVGPGRFLDLVAATVVPRTSSLMTPGLGLGRTA